MQTLPISFTKRTRESVKAGCRLLSRSFLPYIPDAVTNRLPFLGRVCVRGPGDLRVRFFTYGPHGKDRIAIKLARRGIWGYEGETTRIFLPLLQHCQTVIDVGANTGMYALLAAKANPRCRVWAFEPVPFIFDMLQANIHLNEVTNLEAVAAAVSDFCGDTPFFVTRTNGGIPTDSSSCAGFRDQVDEIRLPTTTLDEFVRQHNLPGVDLLKIDTEATEAKVIRGGLETLRKHRPYIICEVLENVDHEYLQQTLQALNYRFFHIAPEGLTRRESLHGSLAVDQRNYLFVPAEKETPVYV